MSSQEKIILAADGACQNNQNSEIREAAIGYLIEKDGEVIAEESKYIGQGNQYTNNRAEYEAVICGIRDVKNRFDEKRVTLHIQTDSQLLVEQIAGSYSAKKMKEQYEVCMKELSSFGTWRAKQVSESTGNRIARVDDLAEEPFE